MTTRHELRLPAHWLPASVRARPNVRPLLAPDPRWFLTDSQRRQISLLRGGMWFFGVQLTVVLLGTSTYLASIAISDRRTRHRIALKGVTHGNHRF